MGKILKIKDNEVDVSIIVSMYNEEESLDLFFEKINEVVEENSKYSFEIVCIDDGSIDRTYEKLCKIAKKDKKVKVIKFSRNFGKEYGMMAGFKYCNGKCAIPIDVDLQDPPHLISEFIEKWNEGYDMVYGIRIDRKSDTLLKRLTAKMFYKIYNLLTKYLLKH